MPAGSDRLDYRTLGEVKPAWRDGLVKRGRRSPAGALPAALEVLRITAGGELGLRAAIVGVPRALPTLAIVLTVLNVLLAGRNPSQRLQQRRDERRLSSCAYLRARR